MPCIIIIIIHFKWSKVSTSNNRASGKSHRLWYEYEGSGQHWLANIWSGYLFDICPCKCNKKWLDWKSWGFFFFYTIHFSAQTLYARMLLFKDGRFKHQASNFYFFLVNIPFRDNKCTKSTKRCSEKSVRIFGQIRTDKIYIPTLVLYYISLLYVLNTFYNVVIAQEANCVWLSYSINVPKRITISWWSL